MSTTTMSTPATHPFLHAGYVEEYWEKGYTILRGVFTSAEIATLSERFDRTYEEGMCHHASWRHQNRVFWVQNHAKVGRYVSGCQWQSWADPMLNQVRTDPRMLAILEPLIGNHLKQIINQMHWKTPGTDQNWPIHQDVRSRKPDHCFRELATSYVQCGIAIDRHWADNGAMKILPDSHRKGDLGIEGKVASGTTTREQAMAAGGANPKQLIDVVMEPGDVALWTPYTIHGGGINVTPDNFRRMYINGYVKWENCDRGQPVFDHGQPVPLTIPALIQYDQLYSRTEPHYPTDKATLVQRD